MFVEAYLLARFSGTSKFLAVIQRWFRKTLNNRSTKLKDRLQLPS